MHNQVSAHEDPISSYRQRFIRAVETADIEALVTMATDDVVIMSPNDTTIYGVEEYRAWWEEYFEYFRLQAFHEPDRHVVVNGDFATEYSAYMIAIVPAGGGNRMRDDGRTLTIWKRQGDGSWKIWQMMWNSSKPIGIGTNRYMSRLMQKKARTQRDHS